MISDHRNVSPATESWPGNHSRRGRGRPGWKANRRRRRAEVGLIHQTTSHSPSGGSQYPLVNTRSSGHWNTAAPRLRPKEGPARIPSAVPGRASRAAAAVYTVRWASSSWQWVTSPSCQDPNSRSPNWSQTVQWLSTNTPSIYSPLVEGVQLLSWATGLTGTYDYNTILKSRGGGVMYRPKVTSVINNYSASEVYKKVLVKVQCISTHMISND